MNKLSYIILLLALPVISLECQIVESEQLVQVDGLVVNKNGNPLPNVNIISFSLARGTITEQNGVYSIISLPGDTLLYSAVGYKKALIKLPDQIQGSRFTNDIVLDYDTIRIEDVVILPWRTYDEFKRAVIAYDATSVETDNMNVNIAMIRRSIANMSIKTTPEAGYRYAMQQNFRAMQTKNMYPVNNLLNPFAWAKLFQGIKNGMFKSETLPKNSAKTKPKAKTKNSDSQGN